MAPAIHYNLQNIIHQLPKIELHLHLEGALRPSRIQQWIEQRSSEQINIDQFYNFHSLQTFLKSYGKLLQLIQNPNDFYLITKDLLEDLIQQNIKYVEIMFTPWFFTKKGLNFHEILAEINRAIIEFSSIIEAKLIFDGPRNFGQQAVWDVFKSAVKDKSGLVIGVGLGGDEEQYPAELFTEHFNFARANGLHTIAHAGEMSNPSSILKTIQYLRPERIGHALGILPFSKIEDLILQNKITLDLCPSSNYALNTINNLTEHPFYDYLQRGYLITLNSDDPFFFKTSLENEYLQMMDLYSLDLEKIIQLIRNSIEGSFMSSDKKKIFYKELLKKKFVQPVK